MQRCGGSRLARLGGAEPARAGERVAARRSGCAGCARWRLPARSARCKHCERRQSRPDLHYAHAARAAALQVPSPFVTLSNGPWPKNQLNAPGTARYDRTPQNRNPTLGPVSSGGAVLFAAGRRLARGGPFHAWARFDAVLGLAMWLPRRPPTKPANLRVADRTTLLSRGTLVSIAVLPLTEVVKTQGADVGRRARRAPPVGSRHTQRRLPQRRLPCPSAIKCASAQCGPTRTPGRAGLGHPWGYRGGCWGTRE